MKKKKLFLGLLSLSLFASSLVSFSSKQFSIIHAGSETIDVDFGDIITVENKTLSYLDQNKEVSGQIILPDGTSKTGKSFVINSYGSYQVIYRAFFGTNEVSYIIQYNCNRTSKDLFTPVISNSVHNGEYRYDNSVKGAVLTLANRNRITFNPVIDFNTLNPADPIFEFIVDPITQGEADISKFTVRLTDYDDANNYVDIVIQDSTMTNDDGEGCYILAGSNMQIKKGYEYGPGTTLHSNTFGANTHSSFRALPISKPNTKASIYMDYSTFGLYTNPIMHYNTKMLFTDLDDPNIYDSSLWKGFTNGKAILSVFANDMINATGDVVVTKIANYDLSKIDFVDETAPTINVDFGNQSEFDIPKAELNKPYPIFPASVSDNFDENLKYTTSVLYFDEVNNKIKDISIIDNTFTPTKEGRYIVVYESKDCSNNKASKRINVFATNSISDVQIDLEEKVISGDIYSPITLPLTSEVNVTGGSGKITVERKMFNSKNEEISFDGDSFIPSTPDIYKVKYQAFDYLGNTDEKELTLNIKVPTKPVVTSEPTFAPVLIKDHTYVIPTLEAVEYVNNERKILNPQVYVNDNLINGNSFVVGDSCQISYRFSGETGSAEFNKAINVVKPHLDNKKIDQTEYFYGDFDSVSEEELKVNLTTNNHDASTLFANALAYDELITRFETVNGYDNYSKIYVKYFDRYDPNKSLTFVIRKNGSQLYISTLSEPVEHAFYSQNLDNKATFEVNFLNKSRVLYSFATTNNFVMNVNYFDDGTAFDGFTNGVYLSITATGVTGQLDLGVSKISNQLFGHRDRYTDSISPIIILKDSVINEGKIGESTQSAPAEVFDVLSDVKCTLDVYDSNDEMVVSSADASIRQTINFNNYGSYLLIYRATDSSNRKSVYQTAINVYDDIAPVLNVNNNLSKSYSVGSKVKIPTYTASDNLGYYTVDVLLILPDYQERLLLKDNNGEVTSYLSADASIYNSSFIGGKDTFVLEMKGKYVLKFLCYDNDYNKVEVKIEFNAN
ncbi:MAG: hypothetical protein J6M95_01875 [Bacilli bacterium]|nr:hypothetical protein [Bacilli bacterium]